MFSLRLLDAFPDYHADFEAKLQSWQEAISPSSDPSTWSSVSEFDALVALGPKAVPLALRHLRDAKGDGIATAAFLYSKLEHDPEYLVDTADPERNVAAILEKNFERNRVVRNALLDYVEHCEMVALQSNSLFCTESNEFEDLVRIGPPVIPQLMLSYKKTHAQQLFEYELLHVILWGHKTGQTTISMPMQYNMWDDWFQKRNYNEAPHYARPPSRRVSQDWM
ncbi:hypothetical protein N658DRAFT_508110 [Parathielavia hyrcaniae]|uniref:Uncharacterized protein n=1 Tax=Parathielavia hyrcaniae TaxID=113614 RepID=A0AAN6T127_9PEZI|nr:hypothetical protein N658DRAFT_508110 [Parathielavia hyrcaniae]